MRTYRNAALVAVLLALAPALAVNTSAQQNPVLQGTWGLDRNASDDVNAKITTAVARMNHVVRPIMRARLRSTNVPAPQVVLSFDAENVRVDEQGRASATIPTDGSPVLWQRETGRTCPQMGVDCVRLSTAVEDSRLDLTLQAEDLRKVNVYTTDGSTLTMNVTVTSPKLSTPLTYKLVYNRVN